MSTPPDAIMARRVNDRSPQESSKRMHGSSAETPQIVVVGGGIGGLAAAAFLQRAGLACTVYEQASRLTEIGAGLVVAPNCARLLRQLGVLTRFEQRAVRLDVGWEFRRWHDGEVLSAESLATDCVRMYGENTYTTHRADLFDALRAAVPEGRVRLGMQCTGIDLSQRRPTVRFADGTTVTADIVVGADGVHSVVRNLVAEPVDPAPSGLCAFRSLVPAELAPEFARRPAQSLWLGPGHHLVHYPISSGNYINLVAFAPAHDESVESWTATATIEEFAAEFDGWDPRLVDLVRAARTPGRWALLDRAPLVRWSTGPVTLLGDAAHPMFPFFAQGAAQAIEDAAVLAACLSEGRDDLEAALRRYELLRIPRTTRVQHESHARSAINHLPDGPAQRRRDASFAAQDPLAANAWIYGYDLEAAMRGPAEQTTEA